MQYPYMTFDDGTEVTHSRLHKDNSVDVYFEQPVHESFRHALCTLPAYTWSDISGYSEDDIKRLEAYLRHNAHIIIELAGEGGFENAAAV